MSEPGKAVFLSYASQDAEAARRICDALRAAGVEVWFDQSELRGGDSWDQKIRRQIKECALFMPIISAATQSRAEGYFRLEWKLAVDRSHLMADDAPFLFPVVIDDTQESAARVPDRFRDVQWTRLSVKDTPESLATRVGKLLGGEADADHLRSATSATDRASGHRRRSPWLRYAWAGVGLVFALIYSLRPWWQPVRRAESRPAVMAPATPTAPPSPARELAAKGLALAQKFNSDRSDFELAEDFYKQALAADSFDGDIWAGYSQLCAAFVYRGFDRSPERREQVRTTAERALRLAPESPEAKLAMIGYYWQQRINLPEVEQTLRQLRRQRPDDHQLMRFLSLVLRSTGKFDEGLALLDASAAAPGGDPVALTSKAVALLERGRVEEAAHAVEASLAQHPLDSTLLLKLFFDLQIRVDRAAALATYEALPTSVRLTDRGVYLGWIVYLWNRQPAKALELVQSVTRDFLADLVYSGPRGYLAGYAQQQLGNPEAAAAEWHAALELVEQHHAKTSTDMELFRWRAMLLASLGQTAEAERALRTLEQMMGFSFAPGKVLPADLETIYLALGRNREVVLSVKAWLAKAADPKRARQYLRGDIRYDRLRGHPDFDALLVEPAVTP